MDVLYIVIPAYNEEETIERVIDDWYPVIEKHNGGGLSRLLIVDDGSTDLTPMILDEKAEQLQFLTVLHKENGGHGQCILYGYDYAVKMGADYVFQTDSDGQTLSSEFEPFWKKRKDFDMVIGSRGSREDGFGRVMVTRTLRAVLLFCFGTWIKDANTPYRLMKTERLAYALDYLEEGETLTNVMLSVIFIKTGMKVLYRNITFRERQGGINSINLKKITIIGVQALKRFVNLNKRLSE